MPAHSFAARVTIDPRLVADFVRSPQGPVFRQMSIDGDRVKREAQRLVGVYRPIPGDPFAARRMRKRRPGTLRDSIVKRITQVNGELTVLVGSDDPIALLHHEGTEPHEIRARRKPMLVYYSGRRRTIVRAKAVRHPGTAPNPYLVKALRVLRR